MCILALIQEVHLEQMSLTQDTLTEGKEDIAECKTLAQGWPSLLCQSKDCGDCAAKPLEFRWEGDEEGRVEEGIG